MAIKNAIPNMMNIETVKDDAAFVPSSSSTRSSEKTMYMLLKIQSSICPPELEPCSIHIQLDI